MKLNRRGYMLVEIILASAIAFGMAYFLINMTIKLKNKNDDLLVETLTVTDQTIIANAIMKNLKGEDCNAIKNQHNLKIENQKKVSIDGNIVDVVNDYATISNTNGEYKCSESAGIITLNIPMRVSQIQDKVFDIELYWTVE